MVGLVKQSLSRKFDEAGMLARNLKERAYGILADVQNEIANEWSDQLAEKRPSKDPIR